MKLLILLFLTNIAHATYDPSLQNLQLDMMYSAKVSSAGVVSEESKDFINGNCVASGTGSATFTCTFNTGIFTVTPNCVAASSTQGWAATVSTSTTASQAVVQTEYIVTPAPNADSFKVACQKQGVDYLTASSAVYSVQNQNYAATSAAYTMSWVSNATVSGTVTRYGDRAYFEGMVVLSGAPTTAALTLTLPSGFVIDVAKVPGGVGNGRTSYGITKVYDSSGGTYPGQGQVRGNSSTTVNLDYWNGSAQAAITESSPMTFATGDSVYFKFDVPIVGWTAAPFAIASYLGVGVLYTGAPVTGTLNSSYNTVTFGTKVFDSATSSYSGGTYTVPVNGLYDISAQVQINSTLTVGQSTIIAVYVDGVLKYAKVSNAEGSITNKTLAVNVGSIPLLSGQLVTIRCLTEGTTNSFSSTAGYSFLSITRTGSY